jgi:tetratricopeptide (TPR) repeat protein
MTLAPALVLVLVAALATYAPALGNGFVWDDTLILDKQLHLVPDFAAAFFPPDLPQGSDFYYRPLVLVTYVVDRAVGGGPLAFHLTPVLLHAAVSVLLLLLLRRLVDPTAALVGALVFAVHPVHVEVVAWMAGRAESIAALGVVGALLAWGCWLETPRPWLLALGGVALLAGLLGKETALAGIPLAATLPWVWPRRANTSSPIALWIALAATAAAYLAMRAAAVGTVAGVARETAVADMLRTALGALAFYAGQLVWPWVTAPVLTSVPADGAAVACGVAAVVAFGAAVGLALVRGARLAVWALTWMAIALGPPLVLVVRAISETPIADRYLYVASAGAALLIALGFARIPPRWRQAALALAGVAVIAGAAITARRSVVWRDNLTFWENAVAAAPDEGFALMKLGLVLNERGDRAGAEARYRDALAARLSPWQRAVVENNLGQVLLGARRYAEAEPLFRNAVAAGPRFPGPYRGLAECLMTRTPQTDAAGLADIRRLLETAARLDPGNARTALLLAQTHLAEGNREEAVHWFTRAAEAAPGSPIAAKAQAALSTLAAR